MNATTHEKRIFEMTLKAAAITMTSILPRELKEFAKRYGLPFLGSRILQDDRDWMDFVNRLWQQKQPPQPVVSTLESFAESPHPSGHWGINE